MKRLTLFSHRIGLALCLLQLLAAIAFGAESSQWKISDFGANGDGSTLNTGSIQKAIDACHAAGGGSVVIGAGTFVSGTVLLKDNVTLHLDQGATLLGSDNPADYQTIDPFTDATGQVRGSCLVGALGVKNVAITGKGTIDGNGTAFLVDNLAKKFGKEDAKKLGGNRPFLVRFVNTDGIRVTDVQLRQAAAWTCHFFQSQNILVEGVKIFSHAHKNNDGIDLDSSHHAVIRNCDIDTGDDAVCFKTTSPAPCHEIEVTGCRLKSDWGTIKIGTESMGDVYNIKVDDCKIRDTRGGGIKILSVDGANIHDVTISNITMENVEMPIFIRLGERLRTYRDAPKHEVGSITDVTISNVKATTRSNEESRVNPPSGIFITGTPGHPIGKVTLEDISIKLPGGGTAEHAAVQVPENEKDYPEFSPFGVLPAYGLMARHIEGLKLSNVIFSLSGPDLRKEMITSGASPASSQAKGLDLHAMMQPVPATAKFSDPEFEIWCGSAVRGDDGKYHMFYSRWPRNLGHAAWVTHSEVAHAVSDSPFGPWKHQDVALPARGPEFWDGSCTHNPTVIRYDGKYYLYYMGNRGDGVVEQPLNWIHRNNQRIGVAVADNPSGPWQRFDQPVIDVNADADAPDALCIANPSVAVRPEGGVLMVYKAVARKRPLPFGGPVSHLVATSDSPLGPFTRHDGEVFSAKGVMFAAEDPFIWRGSDRYWAVVKDNEGNFTHRGYSLALFESLDGFDWKLSEHPLVTTPEVNWQDGGIQKLAALERPQVLVENGQPIALFCAAAVNKERAGTFNVQIPLTPQK